MLVFTGGTACDDDGSANKGKRLGEGLVWGSVGRAVHVNKRSDEQSTLTFNSFHHTQATGQNRAKRNHSCETSSSRVTDKIG